MKEEEQSENFRLFYESVKNIERIKKSCKIIGFLPKLKR